MLKKEFHLSSRDLSLLHRCLGVKALPNHIKTTRLSVRVAECSRWFASSSDHLLAQNEHSYMA